MELNQSDTLFPVVPAACGARGGRAAGPVRPDRWTDEVMPGVLYRVDQFPAVPGALDAARALVTAALADWKLCKLTSDVVQCAGELVANALRHTMPWLGTVNDRPITVGVRFWHGEQLLLEVGDCNSVASPGFPEERPVITDEVSGLPESGIGLFLVRAFSDLCWWEPRVSYGGKVAYVMFDLVRRGMVRDVCHA